MKHVLILSFYLLLPVIAEGQGFSFSKYYDDNDYDGFITVWDAVQDSNGYMFFAIGDGLVLYDGVEWKHIHIGDTGRGTDLFISEEGDIYASGQYNFGRLEVDSLNNLFYHSISDYWYGKEEKVNPHFATIEKDSDIYFYGIEGLNIIKKDSLAIIKNHNSGFLDLIDFKNQLYAINESGIFTVNESGLSLHLNFEKEGYFPTFVIPFSSNELLIGFSGQVPLLFDGEFLCEIEFEKYEDLITNFPYDAINIKEDQIAIATAYSGVYFYSRQGKLIKVYDQDNGLQTDGVYDLFLDTEKNLWLGTSEYIQKLNLENPINYFDRFSGQLNYIYKLSRHGDEVWAQNRLNQIYHSEISDNGIVSFEQTNNTGTLYQLGDSTVIYNQQQSTVRYVSGEILLQEPIVGIVENIDNKSSPILITKRSLIYKEEGKTKTQLINFPIEVNNGLKFRGTVYLYSRSDGIFNVVGDSLERIPFSLTENSGILVNDVEVFNDSLYVATQGSLSNSGIYVLNTQTNKFEKSQFFRNLDADLTSNSVSLMKRCSDMELWVMNGYRVKRISNINEEWEVVSAPYNQIGLDNSLFSILCTKNDVWFAGVEGLFQLTEKNWDYKSDFKTNITGTFIDQDSLIYGGFGEPPNEIILPFIDNALRFTYAAASYIDTDRNRYSYKLEGFDENWSDYSLETQKDYTNIPEGEYVFKVKSKNVFGVEGSTDSFAFTVLPPWYRTWWAYLLYVIGFSGLMYTAHRIRLNQLLKVERMRTKIASDLHDEVSATLTGISYFAEAVKTDRDEARKSHFINLITESAGDAKEKITDIVWSITPENDDWTLFFSKCRRYASDILESADMEYNLNITDTIHSELSMNVRQHLWMIFKEMLTNAVRHSQGTQLDIIFDVDNGVLKLIVQDNGQGFDIDADQMGNGVTNIKKRANAIGAKIYFNSEPEMGTRWRLEYNI